MFQATHKANPVSVNAATILDVSENADSGELVLRLSDGRNYQCDTSLTVRHYPAPGDYLVTQVDGYEYLNPKDVFERKYRVISPEQDAKAMACSVDRTAEARRVSAGALELALRTPGINSYKEVLAAAAAYQEHIDGLGTRPASAPHRQ